MGLRHLPLPLLQGLTRQDAPQDPALTPISLSFHSSRRMKGLFNHFCSPAAQGAGPARGARPLPSPKMAAPPRLCHPAVRAEVARGASRRAPLFWGRRLGSICWFKEWRV